MKDINQEALARRLNENYNWFIGILSSIDEQDINKVPFEGSWTAGQVADHIIKSTGKLPDNQTQTTQRPADQHVEQLEGMFLNFDIKMKSPDFVLPDNKKFSKTELVSTLITIRNQNIQSAQEKDLSALCMDFALPVMGHLTRYEWLIFFDVHCHRHAHQLTKIAEVIYSASLDGQVSGATARG